MEYGLVTELGGFRYIRNRTRQRLNDVQTTFGFGESRPTTGARIFSRANGARAMRATDTRIILIVKLVVRDIVVVDVAPHLL